MFNFTSEKITLKVFYPGNIDENKGLSISVWKNVSKKQVQIPISCHHTHGRESSPSLGGGLSFPKAVVAPFQANPQGSKTFSLIVYLTHSVIQKTLKRAHAHTHTYT